ncbi:MAG: TonB-dependent receptor [Sedimentisphaerales bacterium]|nr:TonB-dependent receptor [Sedimentisphaerales bacterium]
MRHLLIALTLPFASAGTEAALSAPAESAGALQGLLDLSLEELMEVRVVTGASRLHDESGLPSSPVTVLTAEDIHASGLTTIPEILRFACGVDVLQVERRRFAVGIHGLHETFSDRTTLLIDGRLADNPVYGGPDFQGLPLLVEDIARIEIVRSPGSASWGANALTGVINIVTKKPADIPGGMAKTTVTEFGDSYTHLRWAEVRPDYSWRLSAGYEDVKSSEDAIDGTARYESGVPALNPLMGFDTFVARDFTRNFRLDSEAFFDLSDATKLSVGLGHTHIDAGDYELGGYFPRENDREDHLRAYTRLDREFASGNSASLQWASKYWDTNWPMATQLTTQQHEFETQYNFSPQEDHQASVGASFRWDHIDSDPPADRPQQARLAGAPLDEYNAGLFAIDRWTLNDRWTLEGQLRGDWYSGTEADWSGRLTALTSLDPTRKRMLRFSAAKAFRAPLAQLRKASSTRIPLGGGIYLVNLTAPADLDNEQIYCLETGYTAKLSRALSIQVDTFYQRFEDLIGYRQTPNAFGQLIVTPDNIDGANAWGGDLELALDTSWGKFSTWYSYNGFETDQPNQSILTFMPPRHKAGLRFRRQFESGYTCNVNYAYADTTLGSPVVGVSNEDVYHRLDVTLSKRFQRNRGEFMIGVADLLNETLDPVRESITYTGHELPGRTFFVSVRLSF